MKSIIIIQARINSERLPGKVLKNLTGKTILEHIIERTSKCKNVDNIIVATSENNCDLPIVKLCQSLNVDVIQGSADDLLTRYIQAASNYDNSDIIIRITADCPLIAPDLIDECINIYKNNNYDCVAPRCKDGLIRGLDTEVFSLRLLKKLDKIVDDPKLREHVTLYMYKNKEKFNILSPNIKKLYKGNYRLCVDEDLDFQLLTKIYEKFYNGKEIVNINEAINYIKNNPEIGMMNSEVLQRNANH